MKPIAYTLARRDTLASTLDALSADGPAMLGSYPGDAKPVAGGQSLGAMMNLRLAQPGHLVDLDALAELREVTEQAGAVTYGAMVTHAAIEDRRVADASAGLMPAVAARIAYRAVRNRGTLGGSLCHADPAADWISTMPLLDARMVIIGPGGQREVTAAAFMQGAFVTVLEPDELLRAVIVPRRSPGTRWSYRKFCRKTGEFAQAIAAALVDPLDGTERLVLGALDGPPRVFDGRGLLADLQQPAARASLLRDVQADRDGVRGTLLSEQIRLVAEDLRDIR